MIRRKILEKTGDYHAWLINSLRDPEEAAVYLQVALDEYQSNGDVEMFLIALRNVTEAQGGVGKLAKRAHLNRQNLYRTLSSKGNPRLDTFGLLLKGLGFHLSIEPVAA
jgi:probable addiction module antidote protein